VTFLMVSGRLRPDYDYLLARKFSSLWREVIGTGLEADLAGYPAEEQDLIRRAWAAPPPNVDDEVAVELAERIRLEHMKGMQNGIIRELSEAERGRDSERVAQLEAQARELGRAITDMERRN